MINNLNYFKKRDLRQSSQYANYLKKIGWMVERVDRIYVYIKKFPFLGYFIKIQRIQKIDKKLIKYLEKKYRPFQLIIEPIDGNDLRILRELKFRVSSSPSLPTKTSVVDLTLSKDSLLKSFSQKTRYNIKVSKRNNIKVVESKDILEFTNFWRKNFERSRFLFLSQQKNIIQLAKSFGKDSHIFFAEKQNKTIIAVLFVLIHEKTAYYMYAASNDMGRKLFAPTLLTWNAILMAKKSGCKVFDFDGIYDERFPIRTWAGFTKFKRGFKGKEIEYPGSFIKSKFGI